MTDRVHIPHPNKEQIKNMQVSFLKSFGASYRVMRKEDLAFMVSNQSQNYKRLHEDAGKLVMMGMAWKRQRDWYLKLIRSKRVDIDI